MDNFREILSRLPSSVRQELEALPNSLISEIEEIRLRCGQHVRLQTSSGEKIISNIITADELVKTLNSLIKYSYYAYEEDLAKGFVTIEGGHRVGICGKAVAKDGQTSLIKEISSMNIRFAKEIKGCSDKIASYLVGGDGRPLSALIVSPPGCGKTTMLRDIARSLSGRGIKVAVCDERSEIAGMYNSQPSFDLGSRTDVLDGAAKAQGIQMLIRSMSPQVIITDEIGKNEDLEAAAQCLSSGVALITSIHGDSFDSLKKSEIWPLISKKFFSSIIFLSNKEGPGTMVKVLRGDEIRED